MGPDLSLLEYCSLVFMLLKIASTSDLRPLSLFLVVPLPGAGHQPDVLGTLHLKGYCFFLPGEYHVDQDAILPYPFSFSIVQLDKAVYSTTGLRQWFSSWAGII